MDPLCFIRVIYEANCTAAESQQSPQTMERVVKMTKLHSLQMFFCNYKQKSGTDTCYNTPKITAYILEIMLWLLFYLVTIRRRCSSRVFKSKPTIILFMQMLQPVHAADRL